MFGVWEIVWLRLVVGDEESETLKIGEELYVPGMRYVSELLSNASTFMC